MLCFLSSCQLHTQARISLLSGQNGCNACKHFCIFAFPTVQQDINLEVLSTDNLNLINAGSDVYSTQYALDCILALISSLEQVTDRLLAARSEAACGPASNPTSPEGKGAPGTGEVVVLGPAPGALGAVAGAGAVALPGFGTGTPGSQAGLATAPGPALGTVSVGPVGLGGSGLGLSPSSQGSGGGAAAAAGVSASAGGAPPSPGAWTQVGRLGEYGLRPACFGAWPCAWDVKHEQQAVGM